MAGARQILARRQTAESICKVTHTMETVSSVRYRQYYKRWAGGVSFYDSLAQLAYLVVTAEKTIDHPLMAGNDSNCNAVIVTGSNRGLCGAYNSNIFALIKVHVNMAKRFGRRLKIYAQGRKVVNFLKNRGIELAGVYEDFDEVPSVEQAGAISEDFVKQYLSGEIGRLGMVYTRFHSPASQKAQTLALLPVSDLIDDLTTRATVIWPWELVFEDFLLSPSAEEIFDELARMMIHTAVSGCFVEAALSEHLARVVAMRNATDNADEMIGDLTREYNRQRQRQITSEMLDIIGGSIG